MSLTVHDLRVSLRDKIKQIEELEQRVTELRAELQAKSQALREAEATCKRKEETVSMKELIIKEKDNYILKLEADLIHVSQQLTAQNKENGVMDVTDNAIRITKVGGGSGNNTSSVLANSTNNNNGEKSSVQIPAPPPPPSIVKSKRIAISAEPAQMRYNKTKDSKTYLNKHEKSQKTTEFLKNAIFDNDFLRNLEQDHIESIVDCMYPVEFARDSLIIKEGDIGNVVYVLEEGRVEVTKNSKLLCTMSSGKVFGELAILYNCTRTASIRALAACKLWAIERNTFQAIMMRFGIEKQNEYMELLKNVPNFQGLREDVLSKLIDIIEEANYTNGECIVRQYAKGDTFYIISKGKVKITKGGTKWDEPKFVKHMHRGEFFGESALIEEETRPFNVVADDPNGVSCLVLDRQSYAQLLNDPELLKRQESLKMYKRAQTQLLNMEDEEELDLVGIRLAEFEIIGTLGVGGFGRVELVRNTRDMRTYALKVLKKQHVVETKQQDHVLNERNIMFDARSNFICRLYKTFKDKKYLYLLLEPCLGGELWSLLREKKYFEESDTKFYTGCVIEALSYLHAKGIVYRDLKPENIILNARGYCKLVDFGFAKKVGLGKKTWTFCGTPEYVAPEIILNKGHDIGADYWSLGILIFELLSGNPPFVGTDPMDTYNNILKGIEAIDFPRRISKIAATLIKKLCRENAVDRIGYQRGGLKDVHKHKWFEGFSWDSLRQCTLDAPYLPPLKDNTDLSNFDKYPEDDGPDPADDLTGWDFAF